MGGGRKPAGNFSSPQQVKGNGQGIPPPVTVVRSKGKRGAASLGPAWAGTRHRGRRYSPYTTAQYLAYRPRMFSKR
jgi:hypothetical protein